MVSTCIVIIVIYKVMKTQHQNLEFGCTQGGIQNKLAQKVTLVLRGWEIQKTINFGGKSSFF